MKTAPILPDTDILGAIQKAQNKLGLSPSDALAYVTRLLGTGIFLGEILAWIDSGTSSSKAVLDLVVLGITPKDAKNVVDGERLGENVSKNEFKQARKKQARRMKYARMIKANAPFEIIGEAFAEEVGAPLEEIKNDDVAFVLMRWSNTASHWIAETIQEEYFVPQRRALSDATSIMLANSENLVKSCLEGKPYFVHSLDKEHVINFIQAMKPVTKKVLDAME